MSRRLDEALVTIAFFQTEFEAGLARGALEAIGIRALVPTERGGRRRSPLGAELQVFASDRNRAAVELRRLQMRVVSRETDGE